MIIDRELYHTICARLSVDLSEHYLGYDELEDALEEYLDIAQYTLDTDALYHDKELASVLYSLMFTLKSLALGTRDCDEHPASFIAALQCLLAAIVNNTIAMNLLLKRGLYLSASAVFRNQLEMCYTYLNILIDERKRQKYIENNGLVLKRGDWKRYFSFKSLNATLSEFEESFADDGLSFLSASRREAYTWHSSSAHNGYAHVVFGSFIAEDPNDDDAFLNLNIGGIPNERIIANRMGELNDLLFYTTFSSLRLLNARLGTIDPMDIVDEEHQELWERSQSLAVFADEYLLWLKEAEDE